MERTTALGGNLTAASNNINPIDGKVEAAAHVAHQTTDRIADKATAQVDRSAKAANQAVDSAAKVATSAAEWASTVPGEASADTTRRKAYASIRARPIATVAGALAIGYLLGRLARL